MIYQAIDRWNYPNTYLEHHGVKGMRWGVRHDKSHSNGKRNFRSRNDKYRQKMYNKTKDPYYKTASDADIKRERNLKLARNIAIGVGAAAIVALGAGAAYEYMRLHKDDTIKAGQIIQNVGNHDNMSAGNKFYGAVRERDKIKYLGAWGANTNGTLKNIYNATAKNDIKVLGYDNGKKIYDDLVKKNPNAKRYWSNYLDFNTYGLLGKGYAHNGYVVSNPNDKQMIDSIVKNFKDAAKAKGYGLVGDANDRGKRGYHTKAFIDLGGNTNLYKNFKTTKVNTKQFLDANRKARRYFIVESMQVPATKAVAAGAIISSAGLHITLQDDKEYRNVKRNNRQNVSAKR